MFNSRTLMKLHARNKCFCWSGVMVILREKHLIYQLINAITVFPPKRPISSLAWNDMTLTRSDPHTDRNGWFCMHLLQPSLERQGIQYLSSYLDKLSWRSREWCLEPETGSNSSRYITANAKYSSKKNFNVDLGSWVFAVRFSDRSLGKSAKKSECSEQESDVRSLKYYFRKLKDGLRNT